jgi:serine/threonine-protein kinase
MFQEGKKLVAAGDYEHACSKFAEAQRLFPTPGTLLNLGDCYQHLGKLASAWGAYKQAEIAARNAGDTERQEAGGQRAQAIDGQLSKLTIIVAEDAPKGALTVTRDGTPVGEGQWGAAVPVDPGEHAIVVAAPGYRQWSTTVVVGSAGAAVAVNIPKLSPASEGTGGLSGPWWTGQRIAGVAVGGAGVVGLVVGAVFGAQAIAKNDASKAQCSPSDPGLCNPMGATLRGDAKTAGNASTGTIVAGGLLTAGGVVLVLTAPAAKVEVAPQALGVVMRGRW